MGRDVWVDRFRPVAAAMVVAIHTAPLAEVSPVLGEAVVYGDNRTGAVDSYTVTDADGVGRSDLEADYILDVYVLDGAEQLPRTLVQYGSDGSVLSEEG